MPRKLKTYKAHLPGYLFSVLVGGENPQDAQDRLMAGLGINPLPAGMEVFEVSVVDEVLRYEGQFHAPQSLTVWGLPVKVVGGNSPPLVTLELPELE